MAIILGSQSAAAAAAYSVDNSCRFNAADTSYMSKASASTASQTIGTISVWIKIGDTVKADQEQIIGCVDTGYCLLVIKPTTNHIKFYSAVHDLETLTKLRDPSAWYHIFVNWDTTQGTAANRAKIYINGVQNTTWLAEDYPAEDATLPFFVDNEELVIGRNDSNTSNYFDGYMAEMVVLEGTAAAVTDFGEFDEDSPTIWKPKDHDQSSNKGANGFHLDFKDSANLGNDAYGGTDFTETNIAAADQATDSPTNNFCTMNPLDNYIAGSTFADGNCLVTTSGSGYPWNTGTFGLTKGKWYYEVFVQTSPTNNNTEYGIVGRLDNGGTTGEHMGYWTDTWSYVGQGDWYNNAATSGFSTFTTDDVMGCYIDLDNNKIYWAKNGTLENSGTGITIDAASATTSGFYFPAVGAYYIGSAGTFRVNFGNPIWSLSSAVADDNGYGQFEYDPTAGTFDSGSKKFYAICTKNLGEFGG